MNSQEPSGIGGLWKTYNKNQKKFVPREGAAVASASVLGWEAGSSSNQRQIKSNPLNLLSILNTTNKKSRKPKSDSTKKGFKLGKNLQNKFEKNISPDNHHYWDKFLRFGTNDTKDSHHQNNSNLLPRDLAFAGESAPRESDILMISSPRFGLQKNTSKQPPLNRRAKVKVPFEVAASASDNYNGWTAGSSNNPFNLPTIFNTTNKTSRKPKSDSTKEGFKLSKKLQNKFEKNKKNFSPNNHKSAEFLKSFSPTDLYHLNNSLELEFNNLLGKK